MPVSLTELKAMLDVDEPDYPALAEIAADALNHLRKLAASPDTSMASKAVSLAGIIGDESSATIIREAARSRHALVRVAAAHAASLLPDSPAAAKVVSALLDDDDIGVVKLAARAASRQSDSGLAAKLKRANSQLVATARASIVQNAKRERATAMAKKASRKAGGRAARKTGAKRALGGEMPAGEMSDPPKRVKASGMPPGKMS